MGLDARQKEILAAIVREYILSGEAVASGTLVKRYGIEHSPATVRSVMVELEGQGLLHQPHTSAGRIPSATGLHFFIDRLMEARTLSEAERREILSRYCLSNVELQELIREISRLLADLSQQCALVLVPRSENSELRRLDFVPLGGGRVLAVLVMASGLVQNRLLLTESEELSADTWQRIHNYINELCAGKSLSEVRQVVQAALEVEQNRYDDSVARALELGSQALEHPLEDELVIEGKARLLDHPAAGKEEMKALIQAMEHKRRVLHLLDETMAGEGVKVFIGAETKQEELRNFAMVASAYGGTAPLGTLGVIGPSNMDYSRVISLVDFTAGILTELLG